TWEVQIFPTKLIFENRAGGGKHERAVEGCLKGFTVVQDLERGRIEVFGKGFRYHITPDAFDFIEKVELPEIRTRLSLGVHKKQDWDLIKRRCDMAEILPFWMRLAQVIPEKALPKEPVGTDALLAAGQLKETFQVAFQGILCPRLTDENFLGLIPERDIPKNLSPLGIIHEGARQIQALFFSEEKDRWHLLPALPKELHAGRLTSLVTKEGDRIDLEWSKKELKKVIVRPRKTRSVQLHLQRSLKSFRVRKHPRQRGERYMHNQALEIEESKILYLDRFMH
ncbi:MAG: hypothetical protein K1000chlam2_01657, partial [Chlamydiae bacterium]|nr:hypothetical protein [Chlamydiota bacterium]